MALILNNPSFIFLTLSLFLLYLPHSESEFSTSVLNVTEALLKPKTLQTSFFSSNAINDYRSLVIAQLGRDSARVARILSKLTHLNNSDLYQPKTELQPENLSVPVTSGMSMNSGEYFLRIGVGQPPKQFYMTLDTGSDVTWLQCNPCFSCYKQPDPIFNPSTSSSYAPISCEAEQCRQLEKSSCTNDHCNYMVAYGDGSYTEGSLATETVSLGKTVKRVAIGCGHVNRGLFVGAAGLLGLGRGPLSFTSQIKAASFSYCLVNRGSRQSSTLEFNSPRPADSVLTRLVRNPSTGLRSFYYAAFAGVSVGGKRVPVPKSTFVMDRSSGRGGIIVDSGTVVTRLEIRAYAAVRDAFVAMTRHLPRAEGFEILDTCYDLSSVETATLPTVSFEMGDGRSWTLPAKAYMLPVDANGTFCFPFAPSLMPLSILGNVQQQGTRVSFDLVNSVLGFSSFKC